MTTGIVMGEDEPEFRGGSVGFLGTRRLPPNAWITASFRIRNKAQNDAEFKIKVQPMKQDNFAVYEMVLPFPGESIMVVDQPMTAGDTNRYAMDLIVDGRRVSNANARELYTTQSQVYQRSIMVLNDDDDLKVGPLPRENPHLAFAYLTSFVGVKDAPQHWAQMDKVKAVLFQAPETQMMSQRHFDALREYVVRGGTLIFNHPRGILSAVGTPLEELLPVQPLLLRPIESTDALKAIGGTRIKWKGGAEFLECKPVGLGVTTLKHKEFPVVRWRRFGLGYVGVCTFDPSHEQITAAGKGGNYATIYKHLLSYAGHIDYASSSKDLSLSQAVDKMTGIKIPSAKAIHTVVFLFLATFFGLLFAGVVMKRHSLAWGIITVMAVLMIFGIFIASSIMRSNLSSKTGTILAFNAAAGGRVVTEQLCGLLVKGEVTADITSENPELFVRSMPSPWTKKRLDRVKMKRNDLPGTSGKKKTKKEQKAQETIQDPLIVTTENGVSSLRNITLRDSKPRFFNTVSAEKTLMSVTPAKVSWANGQPTISDYVLPEGLSCEEAVFVCPEGFYNMTVDGKTLSTTGDAAKELTDPVRKHLVEYLTRSGKPAPMVVLFHKIDMDPEKFIPDDYEVMGRSLTLIPVRETLPTGNVVIPHQRIRIEDYFMNMGNSRIDGYWISESMGISKDPLKVQAILPLGYNQMDPTELTVDVDAQQGNNIEFELVAYPLGKTKGIALTRVKEGRFTLNFAKAGKAAKQVLDPANGIITLGIVARQKSKISDPVARLRLNAWEINDISVSVKGTCPNDQQGSL